MTLADRIRAYRDADAERALDWADAACEHSPFNWSWVSGYRCVVGWGRYWGGFARGITYSRNMAPSSVETDWPTPTDDEVWSEVWL